MTRKKPDRPPAERETRLTPPVPDVHVAVSPEAIDEVLAANPPPAVLPIGKRGDKGFVWEIDPLWTIRLERLAQAAGVKPQGFLETLLRRAWVSLPPKQRYDDDPTPEDAA